MAAIKSKDNRFRNWTTELYLDSAADDWISKLRDLHIPTFVSPCHDKDVYDYDVPERNVKKGDLKKPHHHIILMFGGKKSRDGVKELLDSLNSVGCENVNDLRSLARYLCHLDDPKKALYDIDQVVSLNGADYYQIIELPSEKYLHIKEMMKFCVDNEVYSFSELSLYAMVHRGDWFRILTDKSTVFMREFLKSRAWDALDRNLPKRVDDNGYLIEIDYDTGEVK